MSDYTPITEEVRFAMAGLRMTARMTGLGSSIRSGTRPR